jgi:hypothetical protein
MDPKYLEEIREFVADPETHGGLDRLRSCGIEMLSDLLVYVDELKSQSIGEVIKEWEKRRNDPNRRLSTLEILQRLIPVEPLPEGAKAIYDRDSGVIPAMFCEHANEVPNVCPCPPDCYCKAHTCKPPV